MKKFIMGELRSNAFLFSNELNEAVLFDCGSKDLEEIYKYLEENKLTLTTLVLTHGHIDHIRGMNLLMEKFENLEVYIGEEEKIFLEKSEYNLSHMIYRELYSVKDLNRVKFIKGGDVVFGFEVIDTPGHTIGGKSFYNKNLKALVTGDTMFAGGSIGRSDFPSGDITELMKSIRTLCEKLPEDTVVYTGHGEESTIGYEKSIHLGNNFSY